MERGRPDITVYTFEAGPGVTLAYPDDELWTRDYAEAVRYAQERGYQVIGNEYAWEDSELVDDFTPAIECQHCGEVIERDTDTGIWENPACEDADNRRYCDESPDHRHHPETTER